MRLANSRVNRILRKAELYRMRLHITTNPELRHGVQNAVMVYSITRVKVRVL